jgi:hypothetical protein
MEPELVYPAVVHGQLVLVKRYPAVKPTLVPWTMPTTMRPAAIDVTWNEEPARPDPRPRKHSHDVEA